MSARDGGPAFPVPDLSAAGYRAIAVNPTTGAPAGAGLSLRDYFAAKALGAMLSNDEAVQAAHRHGDVVKKVTGVAYAFADGMLAARGAQS